MQNIGKPDKKKIKVNKKKHYTQTTRTALSSKRCTEFGAKFA